MNFLSNLANGYDVNCSPAVLLFYLIAQNYLNILYNKYQINWNAAYSFNYCKKAVWRPFETVVNDY